MPVVHIFQYQYQTECGLELAPSPPSLTKSLCHVAYEPSGSQNPRLRYIMIYLALYDTSYQLCIKSIDHSTQSIIEYLQ